VAEPPADYSKANADGIPPDIVTQLRQEFPHFLPAFLKNKFDDECRRRGHMPLLYGPDFLEFARAYSNANQPPGVRPTQQPAATLPISDAMLTKLRNDFPGWDMNHLYGLFDTWIKGKQRPADIEKAFHSFVKTHSKKNAL
jgi:hypothetical protein